MDAAADSDPSVAVGNLRPVPLVSAKPIDPVEFASLMAALGPFEHKPTIAVAVSGGADSLALTLLTQQWVAARGGRVLALTVDHGLRAESRPEAIQVNRWLASRAIEHDVIAWTGPKPSTGLQEAARAARYALLLERCRVDGIAHLLVAHHRNDQAETVLMRMRHGSGPDGLAAMEPVIPGAAARLLRPMLGIPRERIEATLVAAGQAWIDESSNRNHRYQRIRLRAELSGGGGEALAELAHDQRHDRSARERSTAELLVRAVSLRPEGYARLDHAALVGAGEEIACRALDRVLRVIGGTIYPLPREKIADLLAAIRAGLGKSRTLGGCLLTPSRAGVLACRESRAVEPPLQITGGRQKVRWDGRFSATVTGVGTGYFGALGSAGWQAIRGYVGATHIPRRIIPTLPALSDSEGVAAVPHLGWTRPAGLLIKSIAFAPASPLTGSYWNT